MEADGDNEAIDKLREFYRIRGIKDNDNQGKLETLKAMVMIPDFPYDQRKPGLYELEQQFLKDKEEEMQKAEDNVTCG